MESTLKLVHESMLSRDPWTWQIDSYLLDTHRTRFLRRAGNRLQTRGEYRKAWTRQPLLEPQSWQRGERRRGLSPVPSEL